MNALDASFEFTITNGTRTLSLRKGRHFSMYTAVRNRGFGEELTKRQVDLLRICMAIHIADGWVPRRRAKNGHRKPIVKIEVLDAAFWNQPDIYERLKKCVDFLSGGDDWSFRFQQTVYVRHVRRLNLFRGHEFSALVALYSGGLDSAAGLAVRLAMAPGKMVVPVALRLQMGKGKLPREHFKLLVDAGLSSKSDLKPFEAGAFIKNSQIKRDFDIRLREATHRCRPLLFMSLAGLVADSVTSAEVEIFESGVGSVNLPLVSGPATYRTTRSTHPYYLRLMSSLVSHVNEDEVRFVLPFAHLTKAEVVKRARELGMAELARKSVSCILDPRNPLRRGSGRQCGCCAACIYRRQAMLTAGIEEPGAYTVDLFSPDEEIKEGHLEKIRAFHQQAARLADLETGRVPEFFQRYLRVTQAIDTEEELRLHVEVYRRYQREWAALIADARRRGLSWVVPARSLAYAQGAIR